MCGIAGELRFDGSRVDAAKTTRMVECLAPRGPDGAGVYAQGRAALGHRRLKIIDLSEAAQQPMVDAELGLAIAFNGAIYNYPELRDELTQKGYRFFSHGDTEVILKAYHAWGERCVERFNGMFAFCIVERDSGNAFLARDRLGIKPLYLAPIAGGLRFASSLPALLAAGEVDTEVDPVALHHYMTLHSVVPAPYTILRGVRKLPPASYLKISAKGETVERCYWEPAFEPRKEDAALSFEDWKARVLEVLRASVKRRLTADVPVGVLLSGGLDSSLIVGLLAEAGKADLETFSIGFEAVNNEAGDEFQYSDIIAKHFGTRHHKIFIESSRTLSELGRCIGAMSEPMVSHDAIGFYLLSEEVQKHVKVVQSGQGADEIFAGYRWYPPLLEVAGLGADAYKKVFFDRSHDEYTHAVAPKYVNQDYTSAFVEAHFKRPGAQRAVDRALRIDTTIMLVDDPVKRVDNMTMAFGLEGRVPFLDHEVVECAARIPAEHKVAKGGKHVLKEAARSVIPSGVIDRPKGYFPVPALKYLRGPYLSMVRDALSSRAARERGLFRSDYTNLLLSDPESHITPLQGSKLWQIALLELWLSHHVNK